jgi:polyhydroxybutyrate depolymerase
MRKIRVVLGILGVVGVIAIGGYTYFLYTPKPEQPKLSAVVQHATIRVGTLDRSYTFYIPAHLPNKAPLLFVLHGSLQDVEDIRRFTGYEFERLADANGFIVVYPAGFEHNWNDCRKSATYPAKIQNIDDKGLIQALIARFRQDHGADAARVFVTGYSNGGHLAYRLALELPSEIAGIAAFGANLPTPDNSDCIESGKPIPVLIMNGTRDPINPYEGGKVTLFGFGSRGTVRSSVESARYFAKLAGYTDTPTETVTLPHQNKSDPTSVRRDVWRASGMPDISFYSIIEGGHLVPQPIFRAPRVLGRTTSDLDGPAEIWGFFSRQQPNNALQPTVPASDGHVE